MRVVQVGFLALATVAACVGASGAQAAARAPVFTPYEQPTADYTSATCAATIPTGGGTVGAIGVCGNIV